MVGCFVIEDLEGMYFRVEMVEQSQFRCSIQVQLSQGWGVICGFLSARY